MISPAGTISGLTRFCAATSLPVSVIFDSFIGGSNPTTAERCQAPPPFARPENLLLPHAGHGYRPQENVMALHPKFPTSPYAPLLREQRWFPAIPLSKLTRRYQRDFKNLEALDPFMREYPPFTASPL